MNVIGPTSYEDILIVDGICCYAFRKSAHESWLLHFDNCLVESMSKTMTYQMLHSLRRLFATLLVHCKPVNPSELWEKFEYSLSEYFTNLPNMNAKDIHS